MSKKELIRKRFGFFTDFIFAKNKRDIAIGLGIGHSNIIAVEVERKTSLFFMSGILLFKEPDSYYNKASAGNPG